MLASRHEAEILSGIELAGSLKLIGLNGLLLARLGDTQASEAQRSAALAALAAQDPRQFTEVMGNVLSDAGTAVAA